MNSMLKIDKVELCAYISGLYFTIKELKENGWSVLCSKIPEITPETIALKFNVDVEIVKQLLKNYNNSH